MSAHYYDAGSGPHDSEPRDDGLRSCGCRHDGTHWLAMCAAARAAYDERHAHAVRDHRREQIAAIPVAVVSDERVTAADWDRFDPASGAPKAA